MVVGNSKKGLTSNERLDLAILSQEPRATSNSGLGYNESPPGLRRPPRTAAALALLAVPAAAQVVVLEDWDLVPAGLVPGDSFRLLFVSSTTRNASSSSIGAYNTFVQNRAAAAIDARDNTGTTGTGVPIYWLGDCRVDTTEERSPRRAASILEPRDLAAGNDREPQGNGQVLGPTDSEAYFRSPASDPRRSPILRQGEGT